MWPGIEPICRQFWRLRRQSRLDPSHPGGQFPQWCAHASGPKSPGVCPRSPERAQTPFRIASHSQRGRSCRLFFRPARLVGRFTFLTGYRDDDDPSDVVVFLWKGPRSRAIDEDIGSGQTHAKRNPPRRSSRLEPASGGDRGGGGTLAIDCPGVGSSRLVIVRPDPGSVIESVGWPRATRSLTTLVRASWPSAPPIGVVAWPGWAEPFRPDRSTLPRVRSLPGRCTSQPGR